MVSDIEAAYRVTTPLFGGGADPRMAELRLPSFKGVIRFWWRALAWSWMDGNLPAIKREEDLLFGSAAGGQSSVSMRLAPGSTPSALPAGQVLGVANGNGRPVGEGARYLGYGVMEAFASRKRGTKAGQLTRGCISGQFTFAVRMRLRRDTDVGAVKEALIVVGLLGGMGAKSRKGYGSLMLESLRVDGHEEWKSPRSVEGLHDMIQGLRRRGRSEGLPEYTALSRGSRFVVATSNKTRPLEMLDLVGREMMRFRSWGHNGRILGGNAEHNFEGDHHLMKYQRYPRRSHPRRIAFGLPHNYGSRRSEQVGPASGLDRRASPLFIHIHQCGDTPVAVLSFLPARFLPKGTLIDVGGSPVSPSPEERLYDPIHDFLDRLKDPRVRKEPFTRVGEVSS